MNKLKLENIAFESARECLEKIYGTFERVLDQIDSPDAAIIIDRKPNHVIGIEITSADKPEDKQYFNDEKHSKKAQLEQIEKCINGVVPDRPFKSASIPFQNDYIFKAIRSKADRFDAYNENGNYKDIVLVVTSDLLNSTYTYFYDYIIPWTKYLLSSINFPFRKVIFICNETSKGIIIYDSKKKVKSKPLREQEKELGVTHTHTGMLPINKTVNLFEMLNREPIVSRKNKKR